MTLKRQTVAMLVGIVAVAGLVLAPSAFTKPSKTTICHRTQSGKKPYVKIMVGKSVLKGHLRHPRDIIPAPREGCPTDVLTPTQGGTLLTANLLGANEVPPGSGDPDGTGTAMVRLRSGEGRICFQITVANLLLPASGAHIHQGIAGVAGPIVVTLTPPGVTGLSAGCVNTSRVLVGQILANPAGYYANVHTTDFPAGAIRGPL